MRVGFPTIGKASGSIFAEMLRGLGVDVVGPLPVTRETVQKGVHCSPDMMCFPYKVTLGEMIELLDAGADTLLTYTSGTKSLCRQKQYYRLQEYTLNRLGWEFEMHGLCERNFVATVARISGEPWWRVCRTAMQLVGEFEKLHRPAWSVTKPNIGIIGEVYCVCEERVNYGLESLIRRHGGNPYPMVSVGEYLQTARPWWLGGRLRKTKWERQAGAFFEGTFAGHAEANIANLLELIDRGVDGVVHVLPLSCMPESTIEPYIDGLCADAGVPVLRVPVDENNSEVNLDTRIETFLRMMQWKKGGWALTAAA